ncbi:MAG: ABC transporter ATP-binding protein, partial [Clostridia bacterium]
NGAGKSTTIKMLAGILQADSGAILIDGINLTDSPIEAKMRIGYVPDTHDTYEKLTGNEYLNFIGTVYNVESQLLKERAEKYAKLFSMTDSLQSQISTYSHGMKQKILIIGTLIHEPKVWILDEPLTGLDPQSAYELKKLMREYALIGNTVFFSSHVIDVVEKVCDRVAIINKGKLIAVDTLEEIRANKELSLEDLFLTMTSDTITSESAPEVSSL